MAISELFDLLQSFVFVYPIAMSIVWIVGAILFFIRREAGRKRRYPVLPEYPYVSIIIPAHNESAAIEKTVLGALASDYPHFEVIAVDDGSEDSTPEKLTALAAAHPKLRVLLSKRNMGKSYALRCGVLASKGEILITIDADAYLEPDAVRWMARHFMQSPRVGAVTGNPRISNRTSLLAKIQVCEYSSVIGMIKRSQRIFGKILTVSGVISAFRKSALLDVGFWDIDMVTDDIDITWKLQKKAWDVRYEPNALCWILAPETLKGLWRQRIRWAQGGFEVLRKHANIWSSWRHRRLWLLYADYVISALWAFAFVSFILLWTANLLLSLNLPFIRPLPDWAGVLLSSLCLLQLITGLIIDHRYEPGIVKNYLWVVWYPFFYWTFIAFASVRAAPRGLLKKMGRHATWISPDRGFTAHI